MRQEVAGSFRDPAGRVFVRDGEFYRSVTPAGREDYRELVGTGLAKKLIDAGMLTPFSEAGMEDGDLILKLSRIPFITYPYEWCFSRFREAALLTLRVASTALNHNLILKDASAFNVAVRNGHAEFIDHGSFTRYREGEPWQAYRQFVAHFLGPLLLMHHTGIYAPELLRLRLDGIEPGETAALLPRRARWSPSTLIHIYLHARLQRTCADPSIRKGTPPRLPKQRLQAMLETLSDFVAGLKAKCDASHWTDYYEQIGYSAAGFEFKRRTVAEFVAAHRGRCVDFGANTGEFSRIAAAGAEEVIAADSDPASVEKIYMAGNGEGKIVEMVQDLSNPSPGLGLFNCERKSFLERINGSDCVLGLALIHHLRVSANWPLERIVKLFSDCAPAALVEFIPRDDPRFLQLLRSRPDICGDWDIDTVADAFRKRYPHCDVLPIPDSGRALLRLS